MATKIVTKNRAQKISILFENKNESQALRDILSMYVQSLGHNKSVQEYDVTSIGNWLLNHHQPFVNEFANSHTKPSYRLQSKRTYIKNRINDLVQLGLMKSTGTTQSEKNNTDKQLYAFTKEGYIFAWLLEAKYAENKNRRAIAIENFFRELSTYSIDSNSSFTFCFVKYVERCSEEGVFAEYNVEDIEDIIELFPITENYFRFFRLLFLCGLYTNEKTSRIILEIIQELDEETKDLIKCQLKLDIESNYYDGMGASKDWEIARSDNIQNYDVVTLQGYCLECKMMWPHLMDLFQFLKMGSESKCSTPNGDLVITSKLICANCNREDCRFIVPIWYVPTGIIKSVTSIEFLESIYENIQTKGNKVDPSTQISNEYQIIK